MVHSGRGALTLAPDWAKVRSQTKKGIDRWGPYLNFGPGSSKFKTGLIMDSHAIGGTHKEEGEENRQQQRVGLHGSRLMV